MYGDIDYDDGTKDLYDYRRYLVRGRMCVVLACEALGISQTTDLLRKELFSGAAGDTPEFLRYGPGGGDAFTHDLWHLEDAIDAVERHAGVETSSSIEQYMRDRLAGLLRDTAHLVKKRGIIPCGELDVQRVMHDYLRACFPDFLPNPVIPWPTKAFKPDGGIPSLSVAIEFKYARTPDDVRRSIDQVFADATGYALAGQWRRFVLVYYMTAPIEQPSAIEATLRLAGLSGWQAIVTVGDGQ